MAEQQPSKNPPPETGNEQTDRFRPVQDGLDALINKAGQRREDTGDGRARQ